MLGTGAKGKPVFSLKKFPHAYRRLRPKRYEMKFEFFRRTVVEITSKHLSSLWSPRLDISGAEQLFPTHYIIYNFGYHFGLELLGASQNYEK